MNLGKIDKAILKSIIKEILTEDVSLFKEVIKEILEENQVISTKEQSGKRNRLEQLIDKDFDKYDEVFKALA